jgi:hypothetical protein
MNRAISLCSAAVAFCILCSSSFAAAPVNYKFSGTVTTVAASLASQFSAGETITGAFSITQTVFLPDHGGGPISNFTANIGGDYLITASLGGLDVLNDFGGSLDQVKLDTNTFTGLSAPSVAGHTAEYFSLNLLYSGTANLNSSNLLPQFIFSNPLDRSGLRFDGDDSLTVKFRLSDFSQVPEPSAAFLAIISAATLISIWRHPSPIHVC